MTVQIRRGAPRDAAAIARLINLAYEAERFFVLGDRTDEADVLREMQTGTFFLAEDASRRLVGCVLVEIGGERGGFGMLAVDPSVQRQGLGRRLIETAEAEGARAGVAWMEILVVNVRADLLAIYGRLGYEPTGTRPYVHRPTIQPVHFVVMRKPLR
jgi:predicted N-acetyltransferase YhbS